MSEVKAVVHLYGFARWRDSKGNMFAPCGALIHAPDGQHALLKSSTNILPCVTCPVCQEQASSLGRAYSQARRKKEIVW